MKNNKQAQVFHFDVFGKRQDKYDFLDKHSIDDIKWKELQPDNPNYFLVSKDFEGKDEYEKGFKIDEIFILFNSGLATEFDELTIKNTRIEAQILLDDLKEFEVSKIILKYNLNNKKIGKVENAVNDVKSNKAIVTRIDYRPFDFKYTVYTGCSNGIMGRPRDGIMKHMLKSNLALLTCRQQTSFEFQHLYISNKISERCSVSLQTGEVNYIFPIYLYPDPNSQQTLEPQHRTPNLNMEIIGRIAEKLGMEFTAEKNWTENDGENDLGKNDGADNVAINDGANNGAHRTDRSRPVPSISIPFKSIPSRSIPSKFISSGSISFFAPIDILDYVYAVLHSPTYREKYKEFLKIDFPRVPYPKDAESFWQLVELGGEIRQIHLLESQKVNQFITSYPNDGNNTVTRKMTTASPGWEATNEEKTFGRVWINDQQYFDGVPLIAWDFYIGGYQPAQKWLKDRHNRTLNFEDILHYQKIIVALTETHRLMQKVDKVGVEFVTLL